MNLVEKQSAILSKIPRQKGFTLIEILVVVVIIGIAVGAVGISLGAVTNESRLTNDATRIIDWLNQTRNIAIISNQSFRVSLEEDGFFVVQSFDDATKEWLETSLLDSRRFIVPELLSTEWIFEDDDTLELFIFPDRTYTPFELRLSLSGESTLSIVGSGTTAPSLPDEEADP